MASLLAENDERKRKMTQIGRGKEDVGRCVLPRRALFHGWLLPPLMLSKERKQAVIATAQ